LKKSSRGGGESKVKNERRGDTGKANHAERTPEELYEGGEREIEKLKKKSKEGGRGGRIHSR